TPASASVSRSPNRSARRSWPPKRTAPGRRPSTRMDSPARVPQACELTGLVSDDGYPPGTRFLVRSEDTHPAAQLSLFDTIDGQPPQVITTDPPIGAPPADPSNPPRPATAATPASKTASAPAKTPASADSRPASSPSTPPGCNSP